MCSVIDKLPLCFFFPPEQDPDLTLMIRVWTSPQCELAIINAEVGEILMYFPVRITVVIIGGFCLKLLVHSLHVNDRNMTYIHIEEHQTTKVYGYYSESPFSFRVEEAEVVNPDGQICKYPVLYSLNSANTTLILLICSEILFLFRYSPALYFLVCTLGAGLPEGEVVQRVHQQENWHQVSTHKDESKVKN